jgi:hypothetical protein
LVFAVAMVAFGQTEVGRGRVVMSGNVRLKSGVTLRFKSVLVGADDQSRRFGAGGVSGGGETLHRVMDDSLTGRSVGYDLHLAASGDSYVATFGPPTAGNVVPARKYPPAQAVRDGDVISLDLLASSDGKQTLTDYVEIVAHEIEPPAPVTKGEPRDYTIDDGPVTFISERTTVWSHGRKLANQYAFTGKPGATYWISLPGEGRYVLSLVPHEGFVKGGTVRDNAVFFSEYEVRFMNPVAGTGKAWNLYVMHDRGFVPHAGLDGHVVAGVDRLENLTAKR